MMTTATTIKISSGIVVGIIDGHSLNSQLLLGSRETKLPSKHCFTSSVQAACIVVVVVGHPTSDATGHIVVVVTVAHTLFTQNVFDGQSESVTQNVRGSVVVVDGVKHGSVM